MSALRLSDADFTAFRDMLDNPPSPLARLRRLMREPVQLWNETVSEPLPDEFLRMLGSLSGGSGAGDAETGLTQLPSDNRHADRASLSISAASEVSHNHPAGHASAPPAKHSTPSWAERFR